MPIIGGLGKPKRNHAFGHGIAMASRLIFRPRVRVRWDDRGNDLGHVIGFVSLALGRLPGKPGSATPKQTKLSQGSIRETSPSRKVPKVNTSAHVP